MNQLQGILTGFLLMNRLNVLLTPLQLANILYIAIVSRIIGHKLNNDRQAYYGIINGIAFAVSIPLMESMSCLISLKEH